MRFKATWLFFALASCPLAQRAAGWEWQFSAGPWTLAPLTSPVERQAERIVSAEASRLLAPLLSEFTIFSFEPRVAMSSRGYFFSAGCWRRLGNGNFAVGAAASYLDFTLPFTLEDERDIFFQGIPLARITTRGEGRLDLRTFMLEARARWRAMRMGPVDVYAGLGMTALRFSGDFHLPLTASVQTILGSTELKKTEDRTLAELRRENDEIPAWSLSPSASASLHYRLGAGSRLFIEFSLSQGTFLAAGLSIGH
jgi:hypothetical protein